MNEKGSFWLAKQKIIEAHVLALLDFDKLFKMNCDALVWGLEVFLVKRGASWHFSMKSLLASKKKNYCKYHIEFYVIVYSLKH
jgi:hypothetical protein